MRTSQLGQGLISDWAVLHVCGWHNWRGGQALASVAAVRALSCRDATAAAGHHSYLDPLALESRQRTYTGSDVVMKAVHRQISGHKDMQRIRCEFLKQSPTRSLDRLVIMLLYILQPFQCRQANEADVTASLGFSLWPSPPLHLAHL